MVEILMGVFLLADSSNLFRRHEVIHAGGEIIPDIRDGFYEANLFPRFPTEFILINGVNGIMFFVQDPVLRFTDNFFKPFNGNPCFLYFQ